MSNSMSVEKIFIILAIIIGLGSSIDLAYILITQSITSAELTRCVINITLAIMLYRYFIKKHRATLARNKLLSEESKNQ